MITVKCLETRPRAAEMLVAGQLEMTVPSGAVLFIPFESDTSIKEIAEEILLPAMTYSDPDADLFRRAGEDLRPGADVNCSYCSIRDAV